MIVINDIKDKSVELYCPLGELIGVVETELQMNDVCIQIKKLGIKTEKSGYYFKCDGCEIDILSTGRIPSLSHLSVSFFDTCQHQLEELLFNK